MQLGSIREKILDARMIRILFIVILAILIAAFFLQIILSNGSEGMQVFFQDSDDTFMDFFNVQKSIANTTPLTDGIYPPLAYTILMPFNHFTDYSNLSDVDVKMNQAAIMSVVIFFFIWLFIGAVCLSKIFAKYRKQSHIIVFLLFLSAPMMFLIERGNVNVAVFALLAVFFSYYEDKKPLLRELAIVALAIATGIKLYPALFGLLLVRKDTIYSFFRLVGYCIVLTILPAFLFPGGLNNIKVIIDNITKYSDQFNNWPDMYALRSVLGFGALFREISIELGRGRAILQSLASITGYIMLMGSIIGSFFVDKTWKKAMLLACPIILFPAMSSPYNIVFLFIPIMLFLLEEERRLVDYLYLLLFLIILSPIQYGNWSEMVAYSTIVTNIGVILINALLCLEAVYSFIKMLKKRVRSKIIPSQELHDQIIDL